MQECPDVATLGYSLPPCLCYVCMYVCTKTSFPPTPRYPKQIKNKVRVESFHALTLVLHLRRIRLHLLVHLLKPFDLLALPDVDRLPAFDSGYSFPET